MKPRVYLETSIVSYLVALPSRDIVQAAHQQITREWWERRDRFELFVARPVLTEAAAGDADAAARRLAALDGIPILAVSAEASGFAGRLLSKGIVPAKASIDAIHIGVAVMNGMDYLLTWNCTHIANATVRGKIEDACREEGLRPPIICTPEELE
jgi:hypothetical protein